MMRVLWRSFFSISLLVLLGIASCGVPRPSTAEPQPAAPVRPATQQPVDDEEAVRSLIAAEGSLVVQQEIAGLVDLWAADGVVTDARHTPGDASDDLTWRGRDAVRSRYLTLVFPGYPQSGGARDVKVQLAGETASATSTTVIGSEVAQGGDRWTFAKRDGRWWIQSLTYNLEQ